MTRTAALIAVAGLTLGTVASQGQALAQTRPHHSGHLSHNAPQMRHPGSGFHRPNRPSHHHFVGHPGYRPVHHDHMHMD